MGSIDPQTIWQERVAKKQQECFDKIPTEWRISDLTTGLQVPLSENKNDLIQADIIRKAGLLTERELEITEQYTPTGLVSALADGRLTSVEVTLAYCKRAAVAHQLVCSTASWVARYSDGEIGFLPHGDHVCRSSGTGSVLGRSPSPGSVSWAAPRPPREHQGQLSLQRHGSHNWNGLVLRRGLHGELATRGYPPEAGRGHLCQDQYTPDHDGMQALLHEYSSADRGHPQTTDSHNNVFGRTLNPWNTALGAGGSSGGEGALIALRGSPLGVGTDIGGMSRRTSTMVAVVNAMQALSVSPPSAAGLMGSGPAHPGSQTAGCASAIPVG